MTIFHHLLCQFAVLQPMHQVASSSNISRNNLILYRNSSTPTIKTPDNPTTWTDFRHRPSPTCGCVALLRWGNRQAIDAIWSSIGSEYYNNVDPADDVLNDDSNGGDGLNGGSLILSEEKPIVRPRRARAKGARTQYGFHLNTMEDVIDLGLFLWSHPKSGRQEGPSSTREQDQSCGKVNVWSQSQ